MKQIIFVLLGPAFVLLAQSVWAGGSVLTGQSVERQLDGYINDSDKSTAQAGHYSSQGATESKTDGRSSAKSNVLDYKTLQGEVFLQIDPQSQGPFSGTPSGASSQKVRSKFQIEVDKKQKFELKPTFLVVVDDGGRVVVNLALWVLDGPRGRALPGSVYTARYIFTEKSRRPEEYDVAISRSNEKPSVGSGEDGRRIHDPDVKPSPFKLAAGTYVVQAELSINISGDTSNSAARVTSSFDLVEIP